MIALFCAITCFIVCFQRHVFICNTIESREKKCCQLAVLKSKASWVISLFVPQNENKVTSLVKFPLFMTFLTNQDVLVYTFENITEDALYSEMSNCVDSHPDLL